MLTSIWSYCCLVIVDVGLILKPQKHTHSTCTDVRGFYSEDNWIIASQINAIADRIGSVTVKYEGTKKYFVTNGMQVVSTCF